MSFEGRPVVTCDREVLTAYWFDGQVPHPPVVRLGRPLGETNAALYVVGPLGNAIQVLPGDIIIVDGSGVVTAVFKADDGLEFESKYCAPGTQEAAGAAALAAAGEEVRRLRAAHESARAECDQTAVQLDNAKVALRLHKANADALKRTTAMEMEWLRGQMQTAQADAAAAIAAAGIATKRLAVAKTMLEARGTPMPADEVAKVDMYSCAVCSKKTDKAPALSVTHPCCGGIARVCRGCSTVAGALEIAAASNHNACDDERNRPTSAGRERNRRAGIATCPDCRRSLAHDGGVPCSVHRGDIEP